MERIGCIDIGSNSVLFSCAEPADRGIILLEDSSIITGLSKGMNGRLKDGPIELTIDAVCRFKKRAEELGCSRLYVIGTMALRIAENRVDFLNRLMEKCALKVDVLTPEKEGYYSFISVSHKYNEKIVVVDIGGGSTEIVSGRNREIDYFNSLPLGAVSLTDKFIKNDPPEEDEIRRMEGYIKNELDSIGMPDAERIVGIGGTITTLSSIYLKEEYNRKKIDGLYLGKSHVETIYRRLRRMTEEERKNLKGMEPKRERIILAGTSILYTILNWLGFDGIFVSTGGVRIGVIMEKIMEDKNDTNF